jgi:hypothetical protein
MRVMLSAIPLPDPARPSFSPTKAFIARGARNRVLYGKRFMAVGHARFILEFSSRWSDVLLSDHATEDDWESFFRHRVTQGMMRGLLRWLLEAPDHVRDIADTLIQLKKAGVKTANDREVALELITAYESCAGGANATLPEIRRAFKDRYPKSRWPGDVSARRTLLALDIPLGEAKRGRPKGAKSQQKQYGLGKQPRKLIHKKS